MNNPYISKVRQLIKREGTASPDKLGETPLMRFSSFYKESSPETRQEITNALVYLAKNLQSFSAKQVGYFLELADLSKQDPSRDRSDPRLVEACKKATETYLKSGNNLRRAQVIRFVAEEMRDRLPTTYVTKEEALKTKYPMFYVDSLASISPEMALPEIQALSKIEKLKADMKGDLLPTWRKTFPQELRGRLEALLS